MLDEREMIYAVKGSDEDAKDVRVSGSLVLGLLKGCVPTHEETICVC
jgi:hypothetical protein